MSRLYRNDTSLLVERHLVDANLSVESRAEITAQIILIDSMVNDIPLILSWEFEYRVVSSTVDFVLRILNENYRLFCNLDVSERT